MVNTLVNIGIFFIPFYEIVMRMMPYVDSVAPDTRMAKAQVALILAMLIVLLQIREGIKTTDKWILALLAYVCISSFLWWHMPFVMNGVEMPSFWKWQPMFECLVYGVFAISVASARWIDKDQVYKNIMIAGTIMASYMLLQALGIDQYFAAKTNQHFTAVTSQTIVGTLGQPTIAAPFCVMTLAFAIGLRRWMSSAIIIAAVIASQSLVAIGAMTLMLLAIGVRSIWREANMAIIASIVAMILVVGGHFLGLTKLVVAESSGRLEVWSETLNDWKTTPFEKDNGVRYQFTGVGLGVFDKVFHVKHSGTTMMFLQAHNEYLEALYATGLFGLVLLVCFVLRIVFTKFDLILSPALLALAIIAFGTFIWHLAVYQWFTALIVGLQIRRIEDE